MMEDSAASQCNKPVFEELQACGRLCQQASPTLELEIKYPPGVLQREDGRGYMFRLAMKWTSSEADRANNAFSGEMKEKDGLLILTQRTHLFKLPVKN